MAKAVVQFRSPTPNPTVEQAATRLGIAPADIDPEFGVIETDPVAGHYTVLVEEAVAARAAHALEGSADPAEGVFSNPRQEFLGPEGAHGPLDDPPLR